MADRRGRQDARDPRPAAQRRQPGPARPRRPPQARSDGGDRPHRRPRRVRRPGQAADPDLLLAVGVPVPEGRPVADADDAWAAAQEIGPPVVVKPRDANHGRGVATNLTTREQVARRLRGRPQGGQGRPRRAVRPRRRPPPPGRRRPARRRRPPRPGARRRRRHLDRSPQLVDRVNADPLRGDGFMTPLDEDSSSSRSPPASWPSKVTRPIPSPRPAPGVLLRRNVNYCDGGFGRPTSPPPVHPEVAARAVDAARVVGLDVAGVDVMAADIGPPAGRAGRGGRRGQRRPRPA